MGQQLHCMAPEAPARIGHCHVRATAMNGMPLAGLMRQRARAVHPGFPADFLSLPLMKNAPATHAAETGRPVAVCGVVLKMERLIMDKPTSLLDPKFKYVPSRDTNIAKTFARIRREQSINKAIPKASVTPINKDRKQA